MQVAAARILFEQRLDSTSSPASCPTLFTLHTSYFALHTFLLVDPMIDNPRNWAQGGLSVISEKSAIMRPAFVYALVTVAAVFAASAEDFPLTFRTIPLKDVMSFPGGPGSQGQLQLAKPAKLKQEPRAMSRHSLYGECPGGASGAAFIFRLDESKGDGRGYDQLIVDMNQNGDLTDDSATRRDTPPSDRLTASAEQFVIGPIRAPLDKTVAGGRPIYYARIYILDRQLLSSARQQPHRSFGQLMLKAGWYLDTTVRLNGVNHRVGVLDGDSNLRLGDVAQRHTSGNRVETSLYFGAGDCLLVDADGSGKFEDDVFQSEVSPFGPILYLGSKACKVSLTPGCKSLRVESWPEPLAELALHPRGDQVRNVTLVWKRPSGQWQLIRPAVTGGRAMVPPGDYQLSACNLLRKGPPSDHLMLSGTQRSAQTSVTVSTGRVNTLNCGAPLEIKVTAAKETASDRGPLFTRLGGAFRDSDATVFIHASVVGAGGELYSTFLAGDHFQSKPPKPTFSIVDAGGRLVANGNLEYG